MSNLGDEHPFANKCSAGRGASNRSIIFLPLSLVLLLFLASFRGPNYLRRGLYHDRVVTGRIQFMYILYICSRSLQFADSCRFSMGPAENVGNPKILWLLSIFPMNIVIIHLMVNLQFSETSKISYCWLLDIPFYSQYISSLTLIPVFHSKSILVTSIPMISSCVMVNPSRGSSLPGPCSLDIGELHLFNRGKESTEGFHATLGLLSEEVSFVFFCLITRVFLVVSHHLLVL